MPLLKHNYDDNQKIEPVWYIPIIPMVLVNGADGIGTGWMTKIPNYNPRQIVKNLKLMLDDEEPEPMVIRDSFQLRGQVKSMMTTLFWVVAPCSLVEICTSYTSTRLHRIMS